MPCIVIQGDDDRAKTLEPCGHKVSSAETAYLKCLAKPNFASHRKLYPLPPKTAWTAYTRVDHCRRGVPSASQYVQGHTGHTQSKFFSG